MVLISLRLRALCLSQPRPRLTAFDIDREGGFAGSPGHDAHVLYTYSAVQTLALCGVDLRGIARLDSLVQWVASLQAPDGSFSCDEFGDPDTRFGYAALATLRLLGRLDAVDTAAAVGYVRRCCTAEGAFGASPGAEAHAGQTFCCVASLAICGEVQAVATDPLLRMWLSERQNADGGASGRPGKRTDACYAWWVGATTAILSENSLVDRATLTASVLRHQARKGAAAARSCVRTILPFPFPCSLLREWCCLGLTS